MGSTERLSAFMEMEKSVWLNRLPREDSAEMKKIRTSNPAALSRICQGILSIP
jgi:hypothetical protein